MRLDTAHNSAATSLTRSQQWQGNLSHRFRSVARFCFEATHSLAREHNGSVVEESTLILFIQTFKPNVIFSDLSMH
jgi:FPC/CPF motif-containing protein YcgG